MIGSCARVDEGANVLIFYDERDFLFILRTNTHITGANNNKFLATGVSLVALCLPPSPTIYFVPRWCIPTIALYHHSHGNNE